MTEPASLTSVLVAAGALLLLAAAPPEVPPPSEADPGRLGPAVPDVVGPDAGSAAARSQDPSGGRLDGLFTIEPARCEQGPVTEGSYFRMVQPRGDPDSGPYVSNGDSPCGDDRYTPLRPGTDRGLLTGEHQPHPDPAFDGSGNALAERITRPESFFGTRFSTATNPTDPQTGSQVPPPEVTHDGAGGLSGDVRAFAAAWNGQHFNQGAPKPDGSRPGNTATPTGSYDPATGRYTLEWSSQIEGGPFNGFTGVWHLEGTFEPAAGSRPADQQPGPDEGSADAPPPATGTDPAAETARQPGEDQGGRGRLADTGPGLPVALALPLLAAAAVLSRRGRGGR